jgi:hypothetical protein
MQPVACNRSRKQRAAQGAADSGSQRSGQ